jgi:antitoxin ChpS
LPKSGTVPTIDAVKVPDSNTEKAVRAFLRRLPADLRPERVILYGSRARGDHGKESDADVALILSEGADDWRVLWTLGGVAYDVFIDTGILIQPVPISSREWANPERYPRPSFLRNVAREGIRL